MKAKPLALIGTGVIILLISVIYSGSMGNLGMEVPDVKIPVVKIPDAAIPMVEDAPMPESAVDVSDNSKTPVVCVGSALCTTDTITRIVDGDTLYTQNHHIRLALTDTPEKQESGFSDATSFTSTLCPVGSTITIDQDDKQKTDVYGRMIAKITCSGKVLNAELLESGHAVISQQYCKKSEFALESWATKFGC
ncbi:thermonuclease family protein [Candidatus Nitrosotenuis cloacae]|uniref:thermonuclease family protein n=1 Tax=Candidatus Nitrosotenuis cloacae TaxID=1603555 RepID=UPI00227F16AC|nr:thermonuclease family protein [Candidatus Nitrosotenuis cloacae]